MRIVSESRRAGFTLIELLVVIAIIGILISLVLVAAADGVRRAEERATQALITKLETALNDRLDALLNTQAPINQTHRYLAAINTPNGSSYIPAGTGSIVNSTDRRAQVIAQIDYLRAELPDVFFVNSLTKDGGTISSSYPLNFAAAPYPAGTTAAVNFVLPLGNKIPGLPLDPQGNLVPNNNSNYTPPPISGMFGASFSAAGGIYKNLYQAAATDLLTKLLPNKMPANPGCAVNFMPALDGVDNNQDGLIDQLTEVIVTGSPDQPFASYVADRLLKHTHKTARSEMLYAILVEGLSPLGSSFSRDDFTNREVGDTDGDGLPEFIDAWGEPLQFYRWPIYYGGVGSSAQPNPMILGTSDSQRGCGQYDDWSSVREQNPLDPNQLLMAPAWWSSAANASLTTPVQSTFAVPTLAYPRSGGNGNQCSQGAMGFMNYFHLLVDPYPGDSKNGTSWDRGASFYRRAFFSKFLILSAGPDREPGVAQFNKDYYSINDGSATLSSPHQYDFPTKNMTMEQHTQSLIFIENQAAVSDPLARMGSFYEIPDAGSAAAATSYLQKNANSDDITNHNISGISTGVR